MHLTVIGGLNVIRRRWGVLALLILSGIAMGAGYALSQPPSYEGTARVFVVTGANGNVQDLNQGATFAQQAVASYADLATTPYVLDRVKQDLATKESVSQLASKLTVSASEGTVIIDVAASGSNPAAASKLADSVAQNLTVAVKQLGEGGNSGVVPIEVRQIQSAGQSVFKTGPNIVLNILTGSLAGLIIGVAIIFLIERLDTRVHSPEELHTTLGAPILGVIHFDRDAKSQPILRPEQMNSARAESFRSLRTNFRFLRYKSGSQVITVTSSKASEGKTSLALNLALVIGQMGNRVLVIDADLRRPAVSRYLGIDDGVGLSDLLVGDSDLSSVTQSWGTDARLDVVPAGPIPPNPSELLGGESMADLLTTVSGLYDVVIIDAPPVGLVSDAVLVGSRTDGVIFVAASGLRRQALLSSTGSLQQAGVRVLGVVGSLFVSRGTLGGYYGHYAQGDGVGNG